MLISLSNRMEFFIVNSDINQYLQTSLQFLLVKGLL